MSKTIEIRLPEVGAMPAARGDAEHLDAAARRQAAILASDDDLHTRLRERLRSGSFALPRLPSTAARLLGLTSDPSVDLEEIVDTLAGDPVLSLEVLKSANSVVFGSNHEIASVQDAVRRVGIRGTRALVLALSMRGVIFRDPDLARYANEVWRQCVSLATLARSIAPIAGINADFGFLVGLLADVGKVSLIALLGEEIRHDEKLKREIHTGVVGDCFWRLHEEAGEVTAKLWNLPPELVSVCHRHHCFYDNDEHPREAAIASFVHLLDHRLLVGDRESFLALAQSAELDRLGLNAGERRSVLSGALKAWSTVAQAD